MDAPAHHQPVPVQVIRDSRGLVIGRLETQRSTGKMIARNAGGLIVGVYDPEEGTTRDKHGLIVARGNVLAALLSLR